MRQTSEITPFGRRVKIRLLELNMDARELARQVGTSPVQISRILHGKRPGREQIPRIAQVLGIDMDEPECSEKRNARGASPIRKDIF